MGAYFTLWKTRNASACFAFYSSSGINNGGFLFMENGRGRKTVSDFSDWGNLPFSVLANWILEFWVRQENSNKNDYPAQRSIKSLKNTINNSFYDMLGPRWLHAQDDPVALLRAEGLCKQAWVTERLTLSSKRILDIGCGAGFLARHLAQKGHMVIGLDRSLNSLKIAQTEISTDEKLFQPMPPPRYLQGDAYQLPFTNNSFDCVTCMDFLEHVEKPELVIAEAARVLKTGGNFYFHTFNRNWLAGLIIIRGVEWFVKNTPRHMHVLPLFIKPREAEAYCRKTGIEILEWSGIRPIINWGFYKMLITRVVPVSFQFTLTPSLLLSYLGQGIKR